MISAIVLTKNEEKNIRQCLESLTWCNEIVIIDDYSTDKTLDIAKKFNTTVFSHNLNNNFSAQRNFGLSKAKGDWVLFVDADEVVSKKLSQEVQHVVAKDTSISGYLVRRYDHFGKRKLTHGEVGRVRLLRLAHKKFGFWNGSVHESWIGKGEIKQLHNPLDHYPHQTITEFLQEINYYSTLRAQDLYADKVKVSWWEIIVYPKGKFLRSYILSLGFLDGIEGMIYAIMMSFHSFLVRSKLYLLHKHE